MLIINSQYYKTREGGLSMGMKGYMTSALFPGGRLSLRLRHQLRGTGHGILAVWRGQRDLWPARRADRRTRHQLVYRRSGICDVGHRRRMDDVESRASRQTAATACGAARHHVAPTRPKPTCSTRSRRSTDHGFFEKARRVGRVFMYAAAPAFQPSIYPSLERYR